VASGRAVTVTSLLDLVRAAARLPVRHEVERSRVRAHDVPEVRGSADRLREATGWRPEIPLERTVADALDAWRDALGAPR
jgi:GDP-4-dehydro-6-deoxy-D-mannose reductase